MIKCKDKSEMPEEHFYANWEAGIDNLMELLDLALCEQGLQVKYYRRCGKDKGTGVHFVIVDVTE